MIIFRTSRHLCGNGKVYSLGDVVDTVKGTVYVLSEFFGNLDIGVQTHIGPELYRSKVNVLTAGLGDSELNCSGILVDNSGEFIRFFLDWR